MASSHELRAASRPSPGCPEPVLSVVEGFGLLWPSLGLNPQGHPLVSWHEFMNCGTELCKKCDELLLPKYQENSRNGNWLDEIVLGAQVRPTEGRTWGTRQPALSGVEGGSASLSRAYGAALVPASFPARPKPTSVRRTERSDLRTCCWRRCPGPSRCRRLKPVQQPLPAVASPAKFSRCRGRSSASAAMRHSHLS